MYEEASPALSSEKLFSLLKDFGFNETFIEKIANLKEVNCEEVAVAVYRSCAKKKLVYKNSGKWSSILKEDSVKMFVEEIFKMDQDLDKDEFVSALGDAFHARDAQMMELAAKNSWRTTVWNGMMYLVLMLIVGVGGILLIERSGGTWVIPLLKMLLGKLLNASLTGRFFALLYDLFIGLILVISNCFNAIYVVLKFITVQPLIQILANGDENYFLVLTLEWALYLCQYLIFAVAYGFVQFEVARLIMDHLLLNYI